MSRSAPRPLAVALPRVIARAAPASVLARVQERWAAAVGETIAREAAPVAERDGIVTVACRAAVWAQELDLLSPVVVGRLNDALEEAGDGRPVGSLKVITGERRPAG